MRISSPTVRRRPIAAFAVIVSLGFGVVGRVEAAPKTDIVTLANGDRITGEVKGLEQGRLKLSTDAAGTLYIEWDKIVRLQTTQYVQVELDDGLRYFGQVPDAASDRILTIVTDKDARPWTLAMSSIIRIDPIERGGLWQRLDGYVTAGYDYTKSNDLQTFSFTGGLSSRTQQRRWSVDGSSQITSQQGNDDSSRWTLTGDVRRFLQDRYFYEGFGGFEGNDELGLNLRSMLGGAFGRYLVQTSRQEWGAYIGLAYNHEDFAVTGSRESLEAVLGTGYDFFHYDSPEASLNAMLNVYPSLTESGRIRAEGKLRSRYEIVKDLFFEVSLYGSYDNEPGQAAESNSDYGLTTSLGYSF
ncbi:MAG TPA: DUF481 domain-containing protein [Steroidobacteraceae bacterium]